MLEEVGTGGLVQVLQGDLRTGGGSVGSCDTGGGGDEEEGQGGRQVECSPYGKARQLTSGDAPGQADGCNSSEEVAALL